MISVVFPATRLQYCPNRVFSGHEFDESGYLLDSGDPKILVSLLWTGKASTSER